MSRRRISRIAAALALAAASLALPLPIAEVALAIALALASGAVKEPYSALFKAFAVYLGVSGFIHVFVAGAVWATEPIPLLAAGYYLGARWRSDNKALLLFTSRAFYLAAVIAFLTAPFLPGFIKDLWLPALLWSIGSSLRALGGNYGLGGAALEGAGALLALSYLILPISTEVANDIFYITILAVPALALAAVKSEREDYIPRPRLVWPVEEGALEEAIKAYLDRGDAARLIALLAYAYASAGLPLSDALKAAEEIYAHRGSSLLEAFRSLSSGERRRREVALREALARLSP